MIRQAAVSDAARITEIYNHYIEHTVISFEESPLDVSEMLARLQAVRQQGYPWLVAVEDDKVTGYAYASRWNDRSAYRHSAEVTVYVAHDQLGNGWGSKLYQALIDQLMHLNVHTMIGGITLPNDASVALHEKFGMQKVAHYSEVGFKFGQWWDVGYWQLVLQSNK